MSKFILGEQQKKVMEAIANGELRELRFPRQRMARPNGLTVQQLQVFNEVCRVKKESMIWYSPDWVAMDKKSYDKLVSAANKNKVKIFYDEYDEATGERRHSDEQAQA